MPLAACCGGSRVRLGKSRDKRDQSPVRWVRLGPTMVVVAAPRTFLVEPKWFGDSPRAPWKPVAAGTGPAVSAAYRQHLAVVNLRVAARREGLVTDALLADRLGYATETLRRKMRGETWATTEDLARWDLEFPDDDIYPDGARLPEE